MYGAGYGGYASPVYSLGYGTVADRGGGCGYGGYAAGGYAAGYGALGFGTGCGHCGTAVYATRSIVVNQGQYYPYVHSSDFYNRSYYSGGPYGNPLGHGYGLTAAATVTAATAMATAATATGRRAGASILTPTGTTVRASSRCRAILWSALLASATRPAYRVVRRATPTNIAGSATCRWSRPTSNRC